MPASWAVDVVCSNPDCGEEQEAIVVELDDVEWVVCECGHSTVVAAVAGFEPVFGGRR